VTLLLVRHAKAGSRSAWAQDDDLRPLTKGGQRQADALADRLADEPIKRVLSSRFVRCVQTVAPLAERLGLEIEEHPALAEEAELGDTEALLDELAGVEAVLCTHGNVLGAVLKRLRRHGVDLVGDGGDGGGGKGSAWRLEAGSEGTWTAATYEPPG
jgi:phosphohistidine phosphatase SixA